MSALGAIFGDSLPEGWSKTTCWSCGVESASPVIARRREDGQRFYCPNGHPAVFKESTEAKLRKEVERLKTEREYADKQAGVHREAAKWARADAKRAKTKLRKVTERVHAGVCPECNRTFQQLARHMACKHSNK